MASRRSSVLARTPSPPLRQAILCEAGGLAGAGVSALVALALLTYRPAGGSNVVGPAGAAIAAPLVRWLGVAALVVVIVSFLLSSTLFLRRAVSEPRLKLLGLLLLLLGSAATASILLDAGAIPFAESSGPGGIVGTFLAGAMASTFGSFGAAALTVLALLVGLAFATDWLYLDLLRGGADWMAKRIAVHRERRAERREAATRSGAATAATKEPPPAAKKGAPEAEPSPAGPEEDEEAREAKRRERISQRLAESREKLEREAAKTDEAPKTAPAAPAERPARAQATRVRPKAKRAPGEYELPPIDFLDRPKLIDLRRQEAAIQKNAETLEATLREFKIHADVVDFQRGPVVTMYEMELAKGVKVAKLASYADDIAMALAADVVRVVAPIPGKSTVGVEVPNPLRDDVRLRALLEGVRADKKVRAIPLILGMDVSGTPIVEDLEAMPHLLIAGSTGSGKSVCLNTVIMSILMLRSPDEVRLVLIDPKQVELSFFAEVPHLLTPVVTDMRKASGILEWAVDKMEERYRLLSLAKVRNIAGYNKLGAAAMAKRRAQLEIDDEEELPDQLARVVIVIDELADLMFMAKKEIEGSITRLAQKSRAVGIHVILATQRPQAQVVTGLIKANMPTRIAFKVISNLDSRVILDRVGAERLLGMGDMLFLPPRTSNLVRAQGAFVSDDEVRRVVSWLAERYPQEFSDELETVSSSGGLSDDEKDLLYDEAVRIVLRSGRGSASLLQRELAIGYTRASRLMDQMGRDGVVGEYKGSKAREVLLTLEEWEERTADV